jgi:hypothetical protein
LHVVVDRSYIEGISEVETIKRLYAIKFERAFADAGVQSGLQPLLESIREMKIDDDAIPPAVVELENEERYPDVTVANARHLPVKLGDVFDLASSQGGSWNRYVLVTQACDLAVRANGKRGVTHGVLLSVSKSKPTIEGASYVLRYARGKAPNGSRDHLYVRFRPPIFLPMFMLDFCVFSGDGTSRMASDATPPEQVTAGMKQRHEALRSQIAKILQHIETGSDSEQAAAGQLGRRSLIAPVGAVEGVAGRIEGNTVHYECKRTMRVSSRVATDLLAEYSHFTGRTAADMGMALPA